MTTTYKIPLNATEGTEGKPELPAFEIFLSGGTSYVTSMARGTTLEKARKYFLDESMEQPDGSCQRCVDVRPVLTTSVIEECYDALSGKLTKAEIEHPDNAYPGWAKLHNLTKARQDYIDGISKALSGTLKAEGKPQSPPSDQPHKRQESARVDWQALAISRYERMEEYRLEVDQITAQRDALLAALKTCRVDSYKETVDDASGIFETTKEVFWFDRDKVSAAIARAESQTRQGEKETDQHIEAMEELDRWEYAFDNNKD